MPGEVERIPCPQCNATDFVHVATRVDGLDIVRCQKCKLAHINPRPKAERIAKMYEEGYYRGSHDKNIGYSDYSGSAASIKCYRPYGWELLLEKTPLSNMRTLDIGCAFGKWVYWMRKVGAKATGIDLSPEGVNFGREKLGLDLRQTALESLDEPEESFDVITMIDLIEHIVDLDSFMTRLASLLKPSGSVFVQTPNFGSYQTWGDRWRYLRFGLEHLLYFETETLDNLFAKYNMFPSGKTHVLVTIPCDSDSFSKLHKEARSGLRNFVRRLPGSDVIRLIRSKLCRFDRVYEYDDTEREGATIIGYYRKAM